MLCLPFSHIWVTYTFVQMLDWCIKVKPNRKIHLQQLKTLCDALLDSDQSWKWRKMWKWISLFLLRSFFLHMQTITWKIPNDFLLQRQPKFWKSHRYKQIPIQRPMPMKRQELLPIVNSIEIRFGVNTVQRTAVYEEIILWYLPEMCQQWPLLSFHLETHKICKPNKWGKRQHVCLIRWLYSMQ